MATIIQTTVNKVSTEDKDQNKGLLKAISTVEFDNGSYLKIRLYEDKDPVSSYLPSALTEADKQDAIEATKTAFEAT